MWTGGFKPGQTLSMLCPAVGARTSLDPLGRWFFLDGSEYPLPAVQSGAWEIAARSDASDFAPKGAPDHMLSAATGAGVAELKQALVDVARLALPKPGEGAVNARQHARLAEAREALEDAGRMGDLLLVGEELRRARVAFDRLIGRATTEDMLDSLFGRFCIGK